MVADPLAVVETSVSWVRVPMSRGWCVVRVAERVHPIVGEYLHRTAFYACPWIPGQSWEIVRAVEGLASSGELTQENICGIDRPCMHGGSVRVSGWPIEPGDRMVALDSPHVRGAIAASAAARRTLAGWLALAGAPADALEAP